MINAHESALTLERLAQCRLGLDELAVTPEESSQVGHGAERLTMISQHLALNGKGLAQQSVCLLYVAVAFLEQRQPAHGIGRLQVLSAENATQSIDTLTE